ncbi:putative hydrolase [Luteitalea pratensis]|uniref:Putative hydrolase n=1 Tax=Luteitalea pratensis TaxID=1855912 RepID=A0A143PMQ6_LUTPR|nr:M20 family metallo-hydrolase [Luteitalea pratensis]AMY09049.1 putative hydrolase [Luteitalea pratensis]
MSLQVDAARLTHELQVLATFSAAPAPAVTRVVFTEPDRAARAYVRSLCTAAGLSLREDAVGNLFARWAGEDPSLPAVCTGSHIDAIPNAGMYDGTVGVLGALEAIRALQATGLRPRRSIELLMFTSEEPTRFGIGCLGSRLLSGLTDAGAASRLRDRDGATLDDARQAAGFTGTVADVALPPGQYTAFVELHIEQGPLLEQRGIGLGLVTAIAAPASLRVTIDGEGGHAGAVLMPARRDAFLAGAEIALAVEAAARSTDAIDTVATTGVCHVFPGAVNSVPSRCELEVDVRDIDEGRRDAVLARVETACVDVAARRRVSVTTQVVNADPPARCDAAVVDALTASCVDAGFACEPMISRAYHDALFMSRVAPTGMLFIPCRAGVSHRPDEYAAPEDIARGVHVLALALARLAS